MSELYVKYQEMSDDELNEAVSALKKKENSLLVKSNDVRTEIDTLVNELNVAMHEIGKRNAKEVLETFTLKKEHVLLLQSAGGDLDLIRDYPDEQVAQLLGWGENIELTEEQQKKIAVLFNELPYAKRHIIANFDASQVESSDE